MQELNRKLSIAPMMDCTDRHYRYFSRLMTQHTVLYSEMVTAAAIINGDRDYLLGFSAEEQPLALQLGGSDPAALVEAAKIGEQYGYAEINLNVGCPSDRVQAGRFGACLMKEPDLVAECVVAMQDAVRVPVTVKTRLGVDDQDSYELLCRFIETVTASGCTTFILHARKAWLKGLSPRENRDVPPLDYERVYQVKRDYPELEIIINGGVKNHEQIEQHLQHVDGVMIGREAYSNPYFLAEFDQRYYGVTESPIDQFQLVKRYAHYVMQQQAIGVPLRPLVRYLVGLFKGHPGARQWRRYLSEHGGSTTLGAGILETALSNSFGAS
ncbi:MAG: tRNA dihydrouridine(20/20a) synthase DusA [Coxiella sp. (in: Bacteria)]|nr:MAG: tRNA dihydrouridine(20/20a) synthase DusA [Coxiella sp. (in: g-proteobacteria)]